MKQQKLPLKPEKWHQMLHQLALNFTPKPFYSLSSSCAHPHASQRCIPIDWLWPLSAPKTNVNVLVLVLIIEPKRKPSDNRYLNLLTKSQAHCKRLCATEPLMYCVNWNRDIWNKKKIRTSINCNLKAFEQFQKPNICANHFMVASIIIIENNLYLFDWIIWKSIGLITMQKNWFITKFSVSSGRNIIDKMHKIPKWATEIISTELELNDAEPVPVRTVDQLFSNFCSIFFYSFGIRNSWHFMCTSLC